MPNRLFFAAVASLLTLTGCAKAIIPNGDIVNESRDISEFSAINVSSGIHVVVNSDSYQESVEVEAADNVIGYVETYLSGSTLIIKIRDGITIKHPASIKVTVTSAFIEVMSASGGSLIEYPYGNGYLNSVELRGGSRLKGKFIGRDVELSLSGGSRVEGVLNADFVSLYLSGGSVASIGGEANNILFFGSGGSRIYGFNFTIIYGATIQLTGGSVAQLTVNGGIMIDASGGSKFIYRGNGDVIRQSLSGGSTVVKR